MSFFVIGVARPVVEVELELLQQLHRAIGHFHNHIDVLAVFCFFPDLRDNFVEESQRQIGKFVEKNLVTGGEVNVVEVLFAGEAEADESAGGDRLEINLLDFEAQSKNFAAQRVKLPIGLGKWDRA